MKIVLEKYHGLGNDYLVFDPNKNSLKLSPENVRLLCDRHFGAGSDGILEGPILEKEPLEVKIWNPDGSIAEKSGNGVRIFAKYLKDAGYVQKQHVVLGTESGQVEVWYLNEEGTRLKASMGKVSFWSNEIPVTGPVREVVNETLIFGKIPYKATCVSIGNPHVVIFLDEISKELVCRIGKNSETAEYFPERINTQIMKVIDRNTIEIEIYERGAGYTLASGSSGCAAAAAAYRQGLTDSKMYVRMPGGTLEIEILKDWNVLMTGDVGYVGKISVGNSLCEELRALE
ncbi:MAG: diaminopimelate epimerase [Hungatella sp.]|nr:diaminopimelate epimerase [Hungatella sp.]